MGLAKCSNITGRPFFTCFMRHRGVNLVLTFASSWMVSTFIACLDTILCRTPRGMGMYGVGVVNSCILCERRLTLCVSSCRSTLFLSNNWAVTRVWLNDVDPLDCWDCTWGIFPCLLPMQVGRVLQYPLSRRVLCLHYWWRIRDAWYGKDGCLVNNHLLL